MRREFRLVIQAVFYLFLAGKVEMQRLGWRHGAVRVPTYFQGTFGAGSRSNADRVAKLFRCPRMCGVNPESKHFHQVADNFQELQSMPD